jgi:hypothetical protein
VKVCRIGGPGEGAKPSLPASREPLYSSGPGMKPAEGPSSGAVYLDGPKEGAEELALRGPGQASEAEIERRWPF